MEALLPVLLVEDDVLAARAVERVLRRARMQVVLAQNCQQARRIPGHFRTGVFDVELGDGCGVALAAELMAAERLETVVFYTACTIPERLNEAERLGEIVLKGAPGAVLLAAIGRAARPRSDTPPAAEPQRSKNGT